MSVTKTPFKRTKILATVGPSTSNYQAILELIQAGANGFRLNFSHGSYDERDQQIAWIRQASEEVGRPVAILQDLQGPKIRLGILNGDMEVSKGDEIILDYQAEHNDNVLPIQYNLAEKVKVDESIYLFDGKIRATVVEIASESAIKIRIENSGRLSSRKGLNLPDTDFAGDILTEKDIADIEFGASRDIDFVALSFVQSAEDIHSLRQLLAGHGSTAQVIAKIETKAAIVPGVLEEIVAESDGLMVARGDLAVEAGAEVVPLAQQQMVALCREYSKLSIVATQMLASMVDNPEPTRAEVGDVANAVMQGADAVMLSDETASGSYPVQAVAAMKRVIMYTQENSSVDELRAVVRTSNLQQDAIAKAAVQLAAQLGVDAIVAESRSGATAVNIASNRPNLPIISVTSESRTAQQLALCYANRSFVRADAEKAGLKLARELQSVGYFGKDEVKVAIVSGRQPGVVGATDTIRARVIS